MMFVEALQNFFGYLGREPDGGGLQPDDRLQPGALPPQLRRHRLPGQHPGRHGRDALPAAEAVPHIKEYNLFIPYLVDIQYFCLTIFSRYFCSYI